MTPSLNGTFAEDIRPEALLPILSHIAGQTIVREKTLVIFDEVQLCERALTSLKYFCEEAPAITLPWRAACSAWLSTGRSFPSLWAKWT